jgi:hypothetical protein
MCDLAERAHRNLADFYRWVQVLEPSSALLDEDGVVAVAAANDWPSDRLALRSDTTLGVTDWVDRADGFLRERGSCACIFARVGIDDDVADELLRRGYTEHTTSPEMVCPSPRPAREPAPGTTVRLAEAPDDVAAYAAIAAKAFTDLGMLEDPLRELLDNPEVLLRPEVAISLGELDGRPVAGALSVLLGDEPNGYVGWVACLQEGRGHRLGDTVTRLVTNEAFDRGARIVTLEASSFGESTYARMGYDEVYRYRLLIRIG